MPSAHEQAPFKMKCWRRNRMTDKGAPGHRSAIAVRDRAHYQFGARYQTDCRSKSGRTHIRVYYRPANPADSVRIQAPSSDAIFNTLIFCLLIFAAGTWYVVEKNKT